MFPSPSIYKQFLKTDETLTYFYHKDKKQFLKVENYHIWGYGSLKNKGILSPSCINLGKIQIPSSYEKVSYSRVGIEYFDTFSDLVNDFKQLDLLGNEKVNLIIKKANNF